MIIEISRDDPKYRKRFIYPDGLYDNKKLETTEYSIIGSS